MGKLEVRLGRAGSGKTTRIVEEVADAVRADPFGPAIFLIVPADASYAAEQRLLARVPASVRAQVVTFARFAERVCQDTGFAREAIHLTGRRLLFAGVYQRQLESLRVLRRNAPSLEFLDAVLAVFDEFTHHQLPLSVVEVMLESAAAAAAAIPQGTAERASRSLLGKLRELCLLYADYVRELDLREVFDPSQLAGAAAERIQAWLPMAGATVYADGFFDLLPDERELLLAAADSARQVVISLPLAPGDEHRAPGNLDRLAVPQALRALQELKTAAALRGVDLEVRAEPQLPAAARYTMAADLAQVEANLYCDTGMVRATEAPSVRFAAAQNPRAEADGAAEALTRLVRERGLAFRDIAILVPSLRDYAPLIEDSLKRRGIPAYMDAFPSFATHPLAALVLAALDAAETRLAMPSLARLLKCDLCTLTRDEADWLEDYLRGYEVEGEDALRAPQPWQYAQQGAGSGTRFDAAVRDDERADLLRLRLEAVIVPFVEAVGSPLCTPTGVAKAIWALVERTRAKQTTADWMVSAAGAQQPAEASLHEQAWLRLLAILDDLVQTDHGEPLARSFLFGVIRDDIRGQSLSSIPAGVNEVLVTQVAHATAWEARAVFILGAADGQIPRRVRPTGLLQDEERAQFAALFGTRVGNTAKDAQLFERAVVYGSLTRAREHLCLSYPLAGTDGRAAQPSLLLTQLRALFAEGSITEHLWVHDTLRGAGDGQPDVTALTPDVALLWLAAALRAAGPRATAQAGRGTAATVERLNQPLYDAIIDWFEQDDAGRRLLAGGLRGLRHQTTAQPLGRELAHWLNPDPLIVNVHQLEDFAACPFRYFAKSGLHLTERAETGVTPASRGNLLHAALMRFVETQREDMVRWRSMTDDEAVSAMRHAFELELAEPQAAPWRRSALRQTAAREAADVLDTAAVVLTRHARFGLFEPVRMELSFGVTAADPLPPFELELADGARVALRGRVDRVDKVEIDGRLAFRVIDYKSSVLNIDLHSVEHGLQLQLPVYAAVVEYGATDLLGRAAEPAAMLYLPLKRSVKLQDVPLTAEQAREEAVKSMAANGLLVEDVELVRAMDRRLATQATELFRQVYRKDGSLSARAPVLTRDEWRAMTQRVLEVARELSARMRAGEIAVSPYQLGSRTACDFCGYRAVCQVDLRWDRAPLRRLERIGREALLAQWTDKAAQGVRTEGAPADAKEA